MASISQLINQTIKKEDLGTEVFNPSYSMGLDLLDYRNGWIEEEKKCLGITGGKITTFIGKSGSGKSTLAVQAAWNIVKDEENGQIIHLDYERAANKARISKMTGLPVAEIAATGEKYCYLNSEIYSETLYKLVKAVHKLKLENAGDISKETNGKKHLPPTVIIVDSMASMTPQNIVDEEELSGQMSATAMARTNNSIIKRINNIIGDANITILIINHITQKIEIGPVKTKPLLNFLGQDETVPGGSSSIFLADTLIKLAPGPKLDEAKDYGVKGFYVIAEYIKSRSNVSGIKMELIYEQSSGFDNLLTNVNMFKKEGVLQGSGQGGYFIPSYPEGKFKLKAIRDVFDKDEKLNVEFDKFVEEKYSMFLSEESCDPYAQDIELVENIKDNIWKATDGNYYTYDEGTQGVEPYTGDIKKLTKK